jgi:hypothetical protein
LAFHAEPITIETFLAKTSRIEGMFTALRLVYTSFKLAAFSSFAAVTDGIWPVVSRRFGDDVSRIDSTCCGGIPVQPFG